MLTRVAGSFRDFLASPQGAWLGASSFLYFHTLIASSLDHAPHPTLVDGREFQTPPLRYFGAMASFFEQNGSRLKEKVERLALVRPPRLPGAAAGGFFSIVKPPYPVQSFETPDTPITRVALDVGCGTLSSFSVLFRKWENTTPSAYRAQHRGTP